MWKRITCWVLAISLILGICPMFALTAFASDSSDFISWTDDGLKRYEQLETVPKNPSQEIFLEAARNEYERAQIVVRSDTQNFRVTSVEFTKLFNESGASIAAENLSYHFALYEVDIPTDNESSIPWEPSSHGLPLYAKNSMCDALSNEVAIDVEKSCNQPIYLEIYVPANTQPGMYQGYVTVNTTLGNTKKLITLEVFDATVPELKDAKFTNYNWMTDFAGGFRCDWNAFTDYYHIQDITDDHTDFTPEVYEILNNWAEFATAHRQNMVLISTTALLGAANSTVDKNGKYTFDWTLFDKYVDVWLQHGVTRLSGIQFSFLEGDAMLTDDGHGRAVFDWRFYSRDEIKYDVEKDTWYSQYLPALAQHLEEYSITKYPQFDGTENKTLFDIWCQHLYDEPSNYTLWLYYADLANKYLVNSQGKRPKLFDADNNGCTKYQPAMVEKMGILVPQESIETDSIPYYHGKVEEGKEFWTYVCCGPGIPWLNRFVGQPDTTYPMLFWYDAKINATGYLHWGWNFWNVGPSEIMFGPNVVGDSYIVYPDAENKTLLSSIRLEGQRDGIEDWELAQLAHKTDDAMTQQLLEKAVPHPAGQYVTNIQDFRSLRHVLLQLASGIVPEKLPEIEKPGASIPEPPTDGYYVDDMDERIQYSEGMEIWTEDVSYKNTLHYNNYEGEAGTDGGTASFTFEGTGIGILGNKSKNAGKMRVELFNDQNECIDKQIINCYGNKIEPFIHYDKTDLSYGTYTIKMTHVRTETPNNPYSQMVLDAFIVHDNRENAYATVWTDTCNNGRLDLKAAGSPISSGNRVSIGTEVTVTAVPDQGWYCKYIDINGKVYSDSCTIPADKDLIIKAVFDQVPETHNPENVAYMKNVTSSSLAPGYTNAGAVDGISPIGDKEKIESAWANEPHEKETLQENAWVCVDLGQPYTIDKAILDWDTWGPIVPDKYEIQTADSMDGPFTTVVTQIGKEIGGDHVHPFIPTTAQCVRIWIPMEGNENMGWDCVRLNELEVYSQVESLQQDKTELNNQIMAAEAMSQEAYTSGSWAKLQVVLRDAKIVQADDYATAEAIADAVTALKETMQGMEQLSGTIVLKPQNEAEFNEHVTNKTTVVFTIKNAKTAVLKNGEEKALEIKNETVTLSDLTEGTYVLKATDDIGKTAEFLFEVDCTAPGGVTSGVVYAVEKTFVIQDNHLAEVTLDGKVQTVANNRCSITVGLGKHSITAVDKAGNRAEFTVELATKLELNMELDSVAQRNEEDYTAESWNQFLNAKQAAEAVRNSTTATQEQIDAAVATLKEAVDALVPRSEEPDVKPDVKPDETPIYPVAPEKPDSNFVDVRPSDYYYDAVNWSAENGITTGVDSVHFAPDMVCTRAQAVTFLWRAAGSPEPQNRENPFTDVKTTDYFCKAVLWAVEEGITKGTSETTFSPDVVCSRAHIVAFLWRSARMPLTSGTNPFEDVKDTDYFSDAVRWAVAEKVTTGTTNTTFSPDASCTRAQIVTFLYRIK